MRGKFKPLAGQVIVVSGAASGLGLEAARLAAKAGAAVVLAALDEAAVRTASDRLAEAGGRVHPVVGDVRTAEGCDRVARAAAARFGHIDSWIEASGEAAASAHAAKALVQHIGHRAEPGALVAFGRAMGRQARAELRASKGKVAATLITLPKGWRPDSPAEAAAQAALHALTHPMGRMALAPKGQGLTLTTRARKHPGVILGVGLAALGVAFWFGRGRVVRAAATARPRLARAVRPAVIGLAKRRPLQAAKLAATHPKRALKLARALR
jgi:NAD(P)-dependent dehydrogenase (short-subunit alcohol dehydrogenase family)